MQADHLQSPPQMHKIGLQRCWRALLCLSLFNAAVDSSFGLNHQSAWLGDISECVLEITHPMQNNGAIDRRAAS
jgi:hypothetical protein